MLLFIEQFIIIFLILVSLYYFIPVSIWYYIFFIRNREKWSYMRVQDRFPETRQIKREIKYSIAAIAIFAVIAVFIYRAILKEQTKVYFDIDQYGWLYFFISPLIAFVIHDFVFYWTHRFMHLKKIFKYFHVIHHKSVNPTPFSIYAFQPGEAIIQSSIYPIIVFLLPIHPLMIIFFMAYNMFLNLAGHSGFEFMSDKFTNHWLFKFQNTTTNHDMHHTKVNYNFGFYFSFWDRVMKTRLPEHLIKKS